MDIAIIGATGRMGTGIVMDLVSERAICPITRIRVCDLSRERTETVVAAIGDPRLQPQAMDASDPASLQAALAGADLCLNVVPTMAGHQMIIFEAALAAGVAYLDLGGLGITTTAQKQADARFRAAGVTAVIGAGADPGMSNILCRAVADELDTIDRINLYWACELVGPENPVLVPPYNVATVLAEYARPSIQFIDGRHVEVPPMSGVEVLDLPEPWGRASFMHSAHSEQLTVPLADGIRQKGIREFTWKLHLPHREHEAWVGLVKAGFGDFEDPVQLGDVTVRPLDVLEALIARNCARNADRIPRQGAHEIHLAIGHGEREGKPTTCRFSVVLRPNPLYESYVDPATSMNASIAAQLLLLSSRRPGVWAPEEFFAVPPYLEELRKRGFELHMERSARSMSEV